MAATYTIRLDDDVSGPAKRAARGLDKVRAALGRVRRGARSAGSALKKIAVGLAKVGAAAAVAAGAAVVRLGVEFGRATLSAAAFMEQQKMAFGLLMKSGSKGAAELAKIRKVAVELGLPVRETISQYRKLLAMQFTPKNAIDVVKMAADMKALGASALEVSSIIRAITQIKGKGVLQMEELQQQLAEAGVSVDLVLKQLSKATGKTVSEVRDMIRAKEISADQAVAAIKAAVKVKLGISQLGQAAKQATGTLGGMWNVFKARAEDAFLTIGQRLGPRLWMFFNNLSKNIKGISIDKVISSLEQVLDQVEPILKGIAKSISPIFSGMFEGFKSGMSAVKPAFDAIAKALGKPESVAIMAEGFKILGQIIGGIAAIVVSAMSLAVAAIGFFAAGVAQVGPAVSAAWAAVTGAFEGIGESITGALDSAVAAFTGLGTDMVGGLVSGIKGAASAVVAAVVGVVTAAIAAGKASLGISSPSKVFAGMGEQIAAGMSEGMVAGTPGVATTTRDMVSASTGAAAGASQNTYNNRISSSPSINVSGAGSPRETAEAVLKIQLDEARALLEQLGASMGASTV